jgi:hypothetical protein
VAAWFAGFPHGAATAERDNAGAWQEIQVSHQIETQYSAEFQNGTIFLPDELLEEYGLERPVEPCDGTGGGCGNGGCSNCYPGGMSGQPLPADQPLVEPVYQPESASTNLPRTAPTYGQAGYRPDFAYQPPYYSR